MTVHFDQLKASCYVARRVEEAQSLGITLELLSDFDRLRQVVTETEGRAPLTPIFDNTVSDVTGDNGFWILGRSPQGRVVHVQAVRMDDLRGETLAEHLERHGNLFLSPHIPATPDGSDYRACRYVREMAGTICYHGEVWLSPDGEFRGRGLAIILPRIAVAVALMRWAPDYIYGLVHPDLVMKGIPARYGYNHAHPLGVRWRRTDGQGTLDEYITWMTGDDMRDLVEAA
ncbi:MAG: hypothetical protein RLW87_00685 [Alphaproteobacteria bacterium]|jgi:hypothetical protein|nr:hypothetical protein [Pseudomonadota bacterium]